MKKKEKKMWTKKGLVASLIGTVVFMGILATVVQGTTTTDNGMDDNAESGPIYIKASNDDDDNFFEELFDWLFGNDDDDDDDDESFFEELFDWLFGNDDDDDDDDNGFFDWFSDDSESFAETTQIDSNVVGGPIIDENGAEEQENTQDGDNGVEMYWEIVDEEYEW